MGNGPSLRKSLEDNASLLSNYDMVAVNNFAESEEYITYKPSIYVLCDPDYWFANEQSDQIGAVRKMYQRMVELTDWDIQLYIPYQARKNSSVNALLAKNAHINLNYYNTTKVEGYRWFKDYMIARQWGVFRVQNVMIAALSIAIYMEYKRIYLLGVETDWMKNLWVDRNNRLRLKDTHFYGEEDRILPCSISEQCIAMYYCFNSYSEINHYAVSRGIEIYNATPMSFVDAIEKKEII
jgi:hypothetical protein